MTSEAPIRLGVVGLGRAFVLTEPGLRADPRIVLAGCAAPRFESRQAFSHSFDAPAYESIEELCADDSIEAVYIATPHQMHRAHAEIAMNAGKDILIDKPLCVSMADASAIATCAEQTGRQVVVGPSHSFDLPVLEALHLMEGGSVGSPRMIHALNYTDFMYRPRRSEELDTDQGGGVVFSQGIHQIDIVRLLGGGMASSVRASTGQWDTARPTECAYAAHMVFEGGCFASLTYSGYAHFDSNEYCDWIGELGQGTDPSHYGSARKALAGVATTAEEEKVKSSRTFGQASQLGDATNNEHFGPILVSCDAADIRLVPGGIWVYGHEDRKFIPVPAGKIPRRGVLDALWGALREGRPAIQDARWGLASLEVCHAILDSAKYGREIKLKQQVPVRDRL